MMYKNVNILKIKMFQMNGDAKQRGFNFDRNIIGKIDKIMFL